MVKAFIPALMLLLWVGPAQTPARAQTTHVFGSRRVDILPEQYLRAYDPVTVFFNKAVGPAGGGPLDDPRGTLDITPSHPGEYRWLDAETLQFLPTIPWPALGSFTLRAGGVSRSLYTLMAPPMSVRPAPGSRNLDPITEVSLTFAAPIDADQLRTMITLEVKPMPGLDGEPGRVLTDRDFRIKALERPALDQGATYLILLENPVPYGHVLRLDLKLSVRDLSGEAFLGYAFTTKPVFRVTGLGSGTAVYPVSDSGSLYPREQAIDGGTGNASVTVRFSDRPENVDLERVKQLVHFQPAVTNLTHQVSGNNLVLQFEPERDTTYRVSLTHCDLRDRAGRKLHPFGPTEAFVFFSKAPAYVQWRQSQGILERFGPQQFPMEGRDVGRLDVRVFKIDPLDPNYWPFGDQVLVLDEEQRPAGPGEAPAPRTNMPEFIRALGTPLVSRMVETRDKHDGLRRRFGLDLTDLLADISGKQAPGSYLVGYRTPGADRNRHYIRVQVTDLAVSVMEEHEGITFSVTSLRSGEPVPGALVRVDGYEGDTMREMLSVRTNADGLARYHHGGSRRGRVFRLLVQKDDDTLVLDPRVPPPTFFNNHFSQGYQWLRWLENGVYNEKDREVPVCHIFPERPVYKPEEPVHLRGMLRMRMHGRLSDGKANKAKLVIDGPGGQSWSYPVTLSAHGNFYHRFDEKDLPTGTFDVTLELPGMGRFGYTSFRKEAYRIPRFEVQLHGPKKAPQDRPFQLSLTAEYYAGGMVADQDVAWRVTSFPYAFTIPGMADFLFSSDERFSGNDTSGETEGYTRTARTDDDGAAALTLDPTQGRDARPRRYVVEASVTGADEQTVSTTHTTDVLPPFVLGLDLPRLVRDATRLKPRWVVLDYEGRKLADQQVQVRVLHRQWHSYLAESDFTTGKARYMTDVVDTPIVEETLTSTAEIATADYPVAEAGVYVVELSARDALGRMQKVSADVFVAGDTPVSWQKPREQIFEAVWDKDHYAPGDTASLVIKSPYQEAQALVVVEAPDANRYHRLTVRGGSAVFTMTVGPEMTPRIPVHVLLTRGRIAADFDAYLDMGRPAAMLTTAWVTVDPRGFQADLTLTHPKQCLPGEDVSIDIALNDPDGTPLDGEVTLWLVDRAVLALGKEAELNPLATVLLPHQAYLRISDTRNEVVGDLPTEPFPGGDGARPGEGLFGKVTVRKNFQTVPFYAAAIQVVGGRAQVTVPMPDNLTDFAVRAVATSGAERFGKARGMISVRLPVIVQSALPRFVRHGDRFVAGGIGRIVEGDGGPGSAALQTSGVAVEGEATRALTWTPKKPQRLFFPMQVTEQAAVPGEPPTHIKVALAVQRDADAARDAFEIELPIRPDRDWTFREAFADTSAETALDLPDVEEAARPGTVTRELVLTRQPALLKMLAALEFNTAYPYGCTEQRISRVMPGLVMGELMGRIGRPERRARWEGDLRETLAYLDSVQTPSGLFAYWPGAARGYVHLTALVVTFLQTAKEAGYPVDDALLLRGIATLKQALRSDYDGFIGGAQFAERAYALQALSHVGAFDRGYAAELAARGSMMDLGAEAAVLSTLLHEQVADTALIDGLTQDLTQSLVFALNQNEEVFRGLQYRAQPWGDQILASQKKTLAQVTGALYRQDPQNPRIGLMVAELVHLGGNDGWGDTSANTAALTTLSEILDTPETADGPLFQLQHNGTDTDLDTRDLPLLRHTLAGPGAARLTYRGGDTAHLPLAWMRLRYLPAASGAGVAPATAGFAVSRELIQLAPDGGAPLKTAIVQGTELSVPLGTVVEEHVTVVNAEERAYVAVQVPLAAGLEPMNPNLATAPKEARPSGTLTLEPTYAQYHDDAVTFFYDSLPKGTYHFYFRLRASIEGSFTQPPAQAEMMYRREVSGRGAGARLVVTRDEAADE